MSPGPVFQPEVAGPDPWRFARALFAAGIRKGDVIHNTFAYHLTPGGWMMDEAARTGLKDVKRGLQWIMSVLERETGSRDRTG